MFELKKQFLDLYLNYGKKNKGEYVALLDNQIISIGYSNSYLSIIDFDNNVYNQLTGFNICFNMTELDTFLKSNDIMEDGYQLDEYELFSQSSKIQSNYDQLMNIYNTRNRILNYMNSSIQSYCNFNVKETEWFQNVQIMKVKDGSVVITLDPKHNMSMCSSLLPVTKSDKVYLDIYDKDDTFLALFKIQKKGFVINRFIKYRVL